MNTILISMFIDDEMTFDEKIEFVEKVHASKDCRPYHTNTGRR